MATTNNNLRGTCPICFRDFKAVKGPVSRHGYKVINGGYGGWQTGACSGSHFPRYEDSTKGTEYALEQVTAHFVEAEAYLASLSSRPALTWSPRVPYGARAEQLPAPRTMFDGYKGAGVRSHYSRMNVPSYDEVLADAVRKTKTAIISYGRDIEFYASKIASWKPLASEKVAA
jgi:hypothetical protein